MRLNYFTTWATKNKKFFQGAGERPITEAEKFCIYALAGAAIFLCLIKIYQRIYVWF